MAINTVKVRKSTRIGMLLLMTVSCGTTVNYVFANTAKADSTIVANRSYGVDVASYQGTDLSPYARAGAKFAIVKTTEGTWYVNPNAAGQIASSKSLGMMTMGYHFANFSNDSSKASQEADFAISKAKALGVPVGSYYAIDWEKEGSTNVVTGSKQSNTDAILMFMRKVKAAGYLPLLYSGASLLNNNIDTGRVLSEFPNSLWVASYKTMSAQDAADFNYFPSMNGVAIWQFGSNWKGMKVDGNVNVLQLATTTAPVNSSPW